MGESVIPFDVIYATSSDGPKDAESVTDQLESGHGWTSGRRCAYPQEIIVQLREKANIVKIQLTCHETFISQKVEFYIASARAGETPSPEAVQHAKFKRLGFVQFLEKTRSDDDKRERKTIFVDSTGDFLQIKIHENYKSNSKNRYNQVGLLNLKLFGYPENNGKSKSKFTEEPYSLMRRTQSAKNFNDLQTTRGPSHQYSSLSNSYSTDTSSDGKKDPLLEVRTLQKILSLKKQDVFAQDKVVHAKMCQAAIDRLQKSEGEITHYNDLRKKAQIEGEPVTVVDKYRMDAELVRDTVMRVIHLELLLTPREIDSLTYEGHPRSAAREKRNGFNNNNHDLSPRRDKNYREKSPDCDCKDKNRRPRSRNTSKRRVSPDYVTRKRRPSYSPEPTPRGRGKQRSSSPEPSRRPKSRGKSAGNGALSESTCPFCLEDNPAFKAAENLTKHYASTCPVLGKCKFCKRVIETKQLENHWETRCPVLKNKMKSCPRCTQSVDDDELKKHTDGSNVCPGKPSRGNVYCPLCTKQVKNSETAWRTHLMTDSGNSCQKNVRKGLGGVPQGSHSVSSRKSSNTS